MTTPEQLQYSRNYCLLALYAALDKHVLDNPDQAAAVEQYLPGTTGLGERGWSKDIEAMVARLSRDPSTAKLPDIATALEVLTTPQEGFEGAEEPPFTPGQQARLTVSLRMTSPDCTQQCASNGWVRTPKINCAVAP